MAEPPETTPAKPRIRGQKVRRVTYVSKLVRSQTAIREHEHRRRMRAMVENLKRGPCKDCSRTFDPICMDFDHRPYEHKVSNIAALMWAKEDQILREIAKCDLVCANCHRLRTKRRR
jgi:hypothetical protein